ncbi:MAG: DUF1735 and LamG domain-containing protein [Rikenellaceae bacterium]|jgi:hypothetical protein|nr:DUF1735 and LamG domain-containing protein [Rikenellaceae bacterium]
MKRTIIVSFALFVAATLAGCDKGYQYKDVIMVTGVEVDPMIKFPVETAPATTSVTVSASGLVGFDTYVTFAVDPDALSAYNRNNGTNYALPPASSYALHDERVLIRQGKAASSLATVEVVDLTQLDEGTSYVIPLSIVSTTGDMGILEAGRTAFLRLSRVTTFTCVDVTPGTSNAQHGYRTYYFNNPNDPNDLSHKTDLEKFTFEFKIWIHEWHSGQNSTQITRVMNWGPGDDNPFGRTGSSMNLMRLGEGGYAKDQLQWLNSHGAIGSNTRFALDTWYLVTCTYDGMTYRLYINGKLDNQMDGAGKIYYFDSWEIGMSWDGDSNVHPRSQRIPGRLSEMRIWNRALGAKEIAAGICGVPSDSEGLIAYWKFNEGTGTTYHDCTGGGRDLEWTSKTTGNRSFAWVTDDINKCAQ